MPSPTPVIEIRRIAYTVNDEPVEYHRQLCITDKYHYAPMPEALNQGPEEFFEFT